MKHGYAIDANFNIGKTGTADTLKLNGSDVSGGGGTEYYGSDSIEINDANVISVKDSGITSNKLSQDILDILNNLIPTGTIAPYVGNTAPTGWLICNGQILENNDANAKLWNLLHENSNFRSGNDVRLPDLRSRFIKGFSGSGTPGAVQSSALPNIYASFVTFYNPNIGHGFEGAITPVGTMGTANISRWARNYSC